VAFDGNLIVSLNYIKKQDKILFFVDKLDFRFCNVGVQYFSFNLEYNYEDKINWDKNENN
jgi:hypothetical protein